METPTAFDLNNAIQKWRDNLAQSPAFRAENLAELESHLRDSIAGLQARGLSAREAFIIATERVGKGEALQREFGKVNEQAVRLDRVLWMLTGAQLALAGLGVMRVVSQVLQTFVFTPPSLAGKTGYQLVYIGGQFVIPLVFFLSAWWLLNRVEVIRIGVRTLMRQPVRLGGWLLLISSVTSMVAHVAFWTTVSNGGVMGDSARMLLTYLMFSVVGLIPGGLCLLATSVFHRKRLQCGVI